MSLAAGDAACTTGLSKRILDNWLADVTGGFVNPMPAAGLVSLKAMAYGVAKAVVDEITANAHVSGSSVS
jgi:hypothetical protein